jgi:hypothetical protein
MDYFKLFVPKVTKDKDKTAPPEVHSIIAVRYRSQACLDGHSLLFITGL